MSTNDVFDALLALGANLTWGNGKTFNEAKRRLKMWDKAPQPALYQVEPDENVATPDGRLSKTKLRANWVIYHSAGKDAAATPAETTSDIVDAVVAALKGPFPGAYQTLGGLVFAAFIDGAIHKDSGDLDGQAMIIVPITILLP